MGTKISWTNKTLNVFAGCSKYSISCENCYAEKFARRLAAMGIEDYKKACKWDGTIVFRPEQFEKLKHWHKPHLIFVNSMSDTFHENAKDEWIDELLDTTSLYRQHRYQLLTKRAKRMYEYGKTGNLNMSHIRLGISVCNQAEFDKNAGYLATTQASFKFISFEPMLSDIIIEKEVLQCFDQIIIGCESINGRVGRLNTRDSNWHKSGTCEWLNWAIDLVRQAKQAGCKVFCKQIPLNGKVIKNISLFPKELRNQEL